MITRICLSLALLLQGSAAVADATAFVNVNVIPMSSDVVLGSRTVIVTDGVITTIGAFGETPVPGDATVVDGTDRFLMPGLAEMHGHVPGSSAASLERVLTG